MAVRRPGADRPAWPEADGVATPPATDAGAADEATGARWALRGSVAALAAGSSDADADDAVAAAADDDGVAGVATPTSPLAVGSL